jgi:hypothetical protein
LHWFSKIIEIRTNSKCEFSLEKFEKKDKCFGESVLIWRKETFKDILKNYLPNEKVRNLEK